MKSRLFDFVQQIQTYTHHTSQEKESLSLEKNHDKK